MDPIWCNLPPELVEHICNQLPKVRRVAPDLKRELLQRVRVIKEVEYPVVSGLRRSHNYKQIPVEDTRCVVESDGYIRDMCARVVQTVDEGWWLWYPLGTLTSSDPIRVRF